jgi:putative transposase
MQLVERRIIKRTDPRCAAIDHAAFASKYLYTAANDIVWQSYIAEGIYLDYHEMRRRIKDHEAYQALPAKVAQWVLRLLDKNWQSIFAAGAARQAAPAKFLGRPKLPGSKDKQRGRNLLVHTIQALSVPALRQGFIVPSLLGATAQTKRQIVPRARIVPRHWHYVAEVVYEEEPIQAAVDPALYAGIESGIDNLATLTSTKAGLMPRVVNERPVKSVNKFYNERRAELQCRLAEAHTSQRIELSTARRARRIDHYLHTASRRILDLLIAEGIRTLVIGTCPLWKQEVNLGRRTDQQFVAIPYARFVAMLTDRAELVGIRVIVTEESYASTASFLDADALPTYDAATSAPFLSGKRVRRGLYRATNGAPIHADVNGAYNITRKVAPEAFAQGRRGCVVHPMRLAA